MIVNNSHINDGECIWHKYTNRKIWSPHRNWLPNFKYADNKQMGHFRGKVPYVNKDESIVCIHGNITLKLYVPNESDK